MGTSCPSSQPLISSGTAGGKGGEGGWEQEWGPSPSLLAQPPQRGQDTGHTLVTLFGPKLCALKPCLAPHPSKQALIKQKEQREGAGVRGVRRAQAGWLCSSALLAGGDRVDGQQAPELEVLDHRELLQAL